MASFAPQMEGGNQQAQYLYCVIKCGRERDFNGVQAVGGRGDQVHTVVFADLAAVVSDSPDTKYDVSRANMMAHQKVIERVMDEGLTVLPVRFGTVTKKGAATPVQDVQHKLLEGRRDELENLHHQLQDKVELGLKALWRDERAIFEEIVAENPSIRRLRDSLMPRMVRPPEATHFDRLRVGELVRAALDRKRQADAKRILSRIRPIAERIRDNKVIMDRRVLNTALLVDKAREGDCDEAVRKLGEELGERMVLKYTGPTPPFNFCEIVVTWDEE
jgi:hypothetical protein